MKLTKLIAFTSLVVCLLLFMTSCRPQDTPTTLPTVATTATTATNTSQTSTTSSTLPQQKIPAATVPLADAIALYQKTYPNSDLTSIQLEIEFDRWVYELEGVDNTQEYTLQLDAYSKELQAEQQKPLEPEDANGRKRQHEKLNLTNLMTLTDIATLAEGQARGEITSYELSQESGVTYWEVDLKALGRETTDKINAQTKEVLAIEHDD